MKWRGKSRYEFESKVALPASSLSDPSEVQISLCLHFTDLAGGIRVIPTFSHNYSVFNIIIS
jgi:hypothetical protein